MTALLRAPAEGCRHQIGGGHQTIGILMVFVDTQAIKTALFGEFQFIEELMIQPMRFFGIVQL